MVFRHVVERAGRFVHDEDAGFADKRPRDTDALFLTARQLVAVFADLCFQAVRQRGQKFGNIRVLHRLPELLFAVLFQAVSDVLADGSGKEDAVLRHDGDEMAVILNGNFVQGHAVDEDVPLRRFEQPDEEIDDRALARAGRTDKGDALARAHVQGEILDDVLFPVGIAIGDVLKIHPPFDVRRDALAALVFHILRPHDLRKGIDRLLSRHERGIDVNKGENGAVYRTEQRLKEDDFARRNISPEGEKYAEEETNAA